MRAIVFDGRATLRKNYADPRAGKGQALLAVRQAGVCKTDLEILKGYMGFRGVLGHEFVGTVIDAPAEWQGRRAVAEINCACGQCDLCRGGLSSHCRDRTVLGIAGRDGAFADFVVMPVATLHRIPDNVTDDQAVFVEPLAAAFQIIRQVRLDKDAEVVVLGDGRLGQLVARVLKTVVRRAILVGKHAEKLQLAEKQGIQTALLREFAPKANCPVVVDATGTSAGFDLAMKTVRPRGIIVLKSTFAAGIDLNLAPLVINEVSVIGSRCGPFPEAIAALAAGTVEVTSLISKRFSVDDGVSALAAAADPANMKVLIEVGR